MGTQKLVRRCLILGGGDILDYGAVAAELRGDELILCADGGISHCERLGLHPKLIVGDFDSAVSIPEDIERISYPEEKDYTDSTLALDEAFERGYTSVLMAGMLGGRLDHTLGNIQNLMWCANNGIEAKITDGVTEIFALCSGCIVIPKRENAYFSLFSLIAESIGVTIHGGKYPLKDYTLRFDRPRAVSNEFLDTDVTVSVRSGAIAIVTIPRDSAKQ